MEGSGSRGDVLVNNNKIKGSLFLTHVTFSKPKVSKETESSCYRGKIE